MAIFTVGNRVVQARYGTGTVISSNEYHTVVEFDEHGVRNFSTAIVKLEKSATMARLDLFEKTMGSYQDGE